MEPGPHMGPGPAHGTGPRAMDSMLPLPPDMSWCVPTGCGNEMVLPTGWGDELVRPHGLGLVWAQTG